MPLTNNLNLPEPIVEAVKRETYDPGTGDFSCTELISPPKVKVLERRHRDEIFEDVSDKLYSLYGQTMHLILERAGLSLIQRFANKVAGIIGADKPYMVEKRFYAKYGKWLVSAQIDCLSLEDGILSDYKFTSTYSAQSNPDGSMEVKKEWYAQLNIQADILRRNPQLGLPPVQKLQIVALLRDWQPSKAASDKLYPQSQIVIIPIPLAHPENVEKYILSRCEIHQAAKDQPDDDLIPVCTKEERWEDETKYAAIKKGGKRATKTFGSPDEAAQWLSQQKDAAEFYLEERPGFPRRCLGMGGKKYCQASKFCNHYKHLVSQMQNREQ